MKLNKKLVVATLSTVLGLGVVASTTGMVAWYQYSTRATASVIGTTAGSTGLLQIKEASEADTAFARTIYTSRLKGSNTDAKLYPVTFGGMDADAALPAKAYTNPEAGVAKVNRTENEASAAKEYIQYTVDLRATQNGTRVARDVYVTDLVLEDASTSGTLTNALRMHIACGTTYFLVSPVANSTGLNCYGTLDLDGDGNADKDDKYEWDTGAEITYGFYSGEPEALVEGKQKSVAPSSVIAEKDTDGTIKSSESGKKLGTTTTSGTDLQVTVTIWLEGWELISSSANWGASVIADTVHAGLQFDVGSGAFDA